MYSDCTGIRSEHIQGHHKAEKRAKTMTEEQAMKELKEVKKPAANGIFGAVRLR